MVDSTLSIPPETVLEVDFVDQIFPSLLVASDILNFSFESFKALLLAVPKMKMIALAFYGGVLSFCMAILSKRFPSESKGKGHF